MGRCTSQSIEIPFHSRNPREGVTPTSRIIPNSKRERWTASVTYVFRENVKNNELAVPPLVLAIVRVRADQAFSWGFIDLPRGLFMRFHSKNPAGFYHLSLCIVQQATKSLSTGNYGGELHPSCCGHSGSNRTAIAVNFRSQCADDNFALERICRYVARLLLGLSFGALPAPGDTRSSASHCAPLRGLGSSQNKLESHGKERLSNFFRAPPRKQTFGTWEPSPLAKLRPV
jgi:hypothetical protein